MSNYRIQGATGEWEVVIGLEVHAQVTSQSKLFSTAPPRPARPGSRRLRRSGALRAPTRNRHRETLYYGCLNAPGARTVSVGPMPPSAQPNEEHGMPFFCSILPSDIAYL